MKNTTLTTFAMAATLAVLPVLAIADEGLFIGAAAGSAELDEAFDGFDVDADSTAYRFTIGWRFNDYFSVEGGYNNFGRFDQTVDVSGTPTEVSIKADGFLFGGNASLPLGELFALFGRAGLFFWDGDAKINDFTEATPGDTNAYVGAGIRFRLLDRLSLTADGSRYNLDGSNSNVYSIGVQYSFR